MANVRRWAPAVLLALAGCVSAPDPPTGAATQPTPSTRTEPPTTPASVPSPSPDALAGRFDADAALADVRALAALGPREATSEAFRRAGRFVERRLSSLGYRVRRERFRVPAGVSWGIAVPAGSTFNVVAEPPRPFAGAAVIVGAHLDTVPQSPGANDNASGVAVMLELARLAARADPPVPLTFVAFAAEEPRAPGDAGHHYGSQRMVRRLAREGRPVRAMISLDRVATGSTLRVCTGGLSPRRVARALLRTARAQDIPSATCRNRTSDHWPFERAGHAVARVLADEYPEYHTADDRPRVVRRVQLRRVGTMVWLTLRRWAS